MKLEDRVIMFREDELSQGFDDKDPYFYATMRDGKTPAECVKVDPFKGYPHNKSLVIQVAAEVEKRFPLTIPPHWYLMAYEALSRCNGWEASSWVYEGENDKRTRLPYIVLSGKRIPPHPAMTRYLVAHEYGHAVNYFICDCKGHENTDLFDKEYATMRNIEPDRRYGARHWHSNIGEVIANDFRICVTGFEKEFWPHDCPHPDDYPKVHDYWYNMMLEFGYR